MEKISDLLLKTIETVVERKFEEYKKKETKIRPTSVFKVNDNGTYQVILDGHIYNVPCSLGIELKPCQNVWLAIPHGRMEWMHIYGLR